MSEPTTFHAILTWLVAGALFGLGWACLSWAFGELSQAGKLAVLILLIIALCALALGVG